MESNLSSQEQASVVSNPFSYTGDGLDLAVILLKNFVLTILTLGIYGAWARTNMRRYLWGNTQFMGDRAAYTGEGIELFRGWIKLIGILIVGLIVIGILKVVTFGLAGILTAVVYPFIFAIATYGGLRYRASRTTWRQIRFGVDKGQTDIREFIKMYVIGWILSAITLGIYYPFFKHDVRKFLTDRARFGNKYFKYDGDSSELFSIYAAGVLLSIVTLGIYIPWLIRNLMKYRLEHTTFDGISRFEFNLSGGRLFSFAIISWFASLMTFGLATPWLMTWGLKLFIDQIRLVGVVDFAAIENMASDGSATADMAAMEYEIDFGF